MDDIYRDLEVAIQKVLAKHYPGKKAIVARTQFNFGGANPTFEVNGHLLPGSPTDFNYYRKDSGGNWKAIPSDPSQCTGGSGTLAQPDASLAHAGHEVVENTAGGVTFKYCRNCRCEV